MKLKNILIAFAVICMFFNSFQTIVLSAQNMEINLQKKNDFLKRASDIGKDINYCFEEAKSQMEMNWFSGKVRGECDDLLNDVYQYLKEIFPDSDFEDLKANEIDWIKRKDKEVEEAGLEFEGGTMRPFIENVTNFDITYKRVYYLISLIPTEQPILAYLNGNELLFSKQICTEVTMLLMKTMFETFEYSH